MATAPALREDDSPAQRAAALIQPASAHEAETAQTTAKPSSTRVVQPSTVREETGERANPDTGEIPVVQKPDGRLSADPNDPDVAKAIRDEQVEQKKATRTKKRRNKLAVIITCILAVLALAGAGWGAYTWSQTHYYVEIATAPWPFIVACRPISLDLSFRTKCRPPISPPRTCLRHGVTS